MSPIDGIILYIIYPITQILWWVILISVILSWLINFNVINTHNQFVATIWRLTSAITEPLLRPIRGILPSLGGLDFSPIILLLLIGFIQGYILPELMRIF